MSSNKLKYCGKLTGHGNWVTAISTVNAAANGIVVSASRDKKLMIWKMHPIQEEHDVFQMTREPGVAVRSLTGHGQFVQDVAVSDDGRFALSGSWDRTLRLWDIENGKCVRTFVKHTDDVTSVAFSSDNRQIVSCSRDRTICLWNTLADCKYTFGPQMVPDDSHTDWVSAVRFSPAAHSNPRIVSCGWDKVVKVWDVPEVSLKTNLIGHSGPIYNLTISPDGSLCASGGKDGVAMLWDVTEGKHLYSLDAGPPIHALCFSPCNYWLCAATGKSIKIWDLEHKGVVSELVKPKEMEATKEVSARSQAKEAIEQTWCVSLAWSTDGTALYAGTTDGNIYVYKVAQNAMEDPIPVGH